MNLKLGFKIRKYRDEDYKDVCLLISRTFRKFNYKEGTRSGVRDYINFYRNYKKNLKEVRKSFSKTNIFFVAVSLESDEVIGVIRGVNNRLVNLFVDSEFQGKGVGVSLLKRFEKDCRKEGSREINIRASLHGVSFYEKYGYQKVSYVTSMKGVMVQPMIKRF